MNHDEKEFMSTTVALAVERGIKAYDEQQQAYRTEAIAAALRLHLAECPTALAATKSKSFLAGMMLVASAVASLIAVIVNHLWK